MGRPRIVRKAEEAKAIPPDQPIQVEIPPEGVVELQTSPDVSESQFPLGVKPSEAPKKEAPPKVEPKPEAKEENVTSLKAQLEEIKKASEENRRRAEEAAQREAAFRQQYEQQQREFQSTTARAGQAELDAVNNAIAAATSELASAKNELKTAGDAGDWSAIAEAQERIAEAKTRVIQLGDSKAYLTERAEKAKSAPPPPTPQMGDPVDNYIANLSATPRQKDWLRNHRDVLTDGVLFQQLTYLNAKALRDGKQVDSPEYYQFIEEQMGFRQPPPVKPPEDIDEEPAAPQIVSAPVSREAPSAETGRPATRITLTAAQREAARDAGVDEVTYARNLLLLEQRKKQGMYTEH